MVLAHLFHHVCGVVLYRFCQGTCKLLEHLLQPVVAGGMIFLTGTLATVSQSIMKLIANSAAQTQDWLNRSAPSQTLMSRQRSVNHSKDVTIQSHTLCLWLRLKTGQE